MGLRLLVGHRGQRRVRFIQRTGPAVRVEWTETGQAEPWAPLLGALVTQLRAWREDGVHEDEIMVLLSSAKQVKAVQAAVEEAGLGRIRVADRGFQTSQAAKGKEAEAVAVYQAQYWSGTPGGWRALFVAMTRARHALWVGGFGPTATAIRKDSSLRDLPSILRESADFSNQVETGDNPTRDELIESAIEYLELELGKPLSEKQIHPLLRELGEAGDVSIAPIAGISPILAWMHPSLGRRALLGGFPSAEACRRVEAAGYSVYLIS